VPWPLTTGVTNVWATTIYCKGQFPVLMWATPHNVYTHARSLSGWIAYYSDMNQDRIEVLFQTDNGPRYIDYVPAAWPKPATNATDGK
jgi:hypothetical protein